MRNLWLAGLIGGAILGEMFEHEGAAFGAIGGTFLGMLWARLQAADAARRHLEQRLDRLGAEVASLADARSPSTPRQVSATAPIDPVPVAQPEPTSTDSVAAHTVSLPEAAVDDVRNQPALQAFVWPPAWWTRLLSGNPLVKVGVVLLFFGSASALRLAADYGLLPFGLRLFIAAAAGAGLIVFGVSRARDDVRRNFGLVIQGGGFALLYLVAYFMLARYQMIGQTPAFAIFAALGISCVLLAARQEGPALAVLGISGAFLAPVLAGGKAETPLPLFSYFALLNLFILSVDWVKAWRALNIAGFVFTLVVGMAWAIDAYRPQHLWVTEFFLAAFVIAYSAMPVATALLRAAGAGGWREGLLLFGTPLIGAALQSQLMQDIRYGLAWSALVASLYYFGLWCLLYRRKARSDAATQLIERAMLGIALAFLTVAIPLAFDAQVTSAFWAAEGAAVFWFGVRAERRLAQVSGLLMQLAAGLALLHGWDELSHRLPLFNDAALGAVLIASAGLVSARLLRSQADTAGKVFVAPLLPVLWAMLWWLGIGLEEIERFTAREFHAASALLYVTLTVLALEALTVAWSWPQLRFAAVLSAPTLWLTSLLSIERTGHPLAGLMLLALPLALAVHGWLLARHERLDERWGIGIRHVAVWWLLLLVIAAELAWQARQLAPGVSLWPLVAWGLTLAGGLALSCLGHARQWWPFASPVGRYIGLGAVLPLAGLVLLGVASNMAHSGSGMNLPWLPLLNAFDLTQLAGFGAIWLLARAAATERSSSLRQLLAALVFLWASASAARMAHHWGGVPFEWHEMTDSTLFQALLTLIWTLTAISVMIFAARRALRQRWYLGFGLLGIVGAKLLLIDAAGHGTLAWTGSLLGVAVLVLAAAYFAPLPPQDHAPDLTLMQ